MSAIKFINAGKERSSMLSNKISVIFILLIFVSLSAFVFAQQTGSYEGVLFAISGDPEGFQEDSITQYYLFSNGQTYEIIYSGEIFPDFIGNNIQVQGTMTGNIIMAT